MAKAASLMDNSEVARRLTLLRHAVSGGSQTAFAAKLGIDVRRWNNFELGSPLSKEIAVLLVTKVPGVSLDWLYLGRVETLPFVLRAELEAAAKETTSAGRPAGKRA